MMIRNWFSKHPARIDPDELERKATDSLAKVQSQQPRVNALTSYLAERKDRNGFGNDFEITLLTPRPRGDLRFPTMPRGAR